MSIQTDIPKAPFEVESLRVVDALQASLTELYAALGADASAPQDVSRRFGLNKNLAWKIAKILAAPEPKDALPHLPGKAGVSILLKAFAKAGAPQNLLDWVDTSATAVDDMVQRHLGDRSALELLLDGMQPPDGPRLELSRRHLFLGSSGVWGVQVKTRIFAAFIAPNEADPTRLDLVTVGAFHEFRRLRHTVRWSLFRVTGWDDDENERSPIVPLDPTVSRQEASILRPFCSDGLPTLDVVGDTCSRDYVLEPGPVGNFGAVDVAVGHRLDGMGGRYATRPGDAGELYTTITAPAEHLVFDVYSHESLGFPVDPEVRVFGRAFDHGERTNAPRDEALMLPITGETFPIPGRPPSSATPLAPSMKDLIPWVFQTRGWNAAEFRGIRLTMKYPPYGSTVLLRFPLPANPEPGQ